MKCNPLKNLSGWSIGTTELVNLLVYATNNENDIQPSRSFPMLNVMLHLNAARLGHLPRFSSNVGGRTLGEAVAGKDPQGGSKLVHLHWFWQLRVDSRRL